MFHPAKLIALTLALAVAVALSAAAAEDKKPEALELPDFSVAPADHRPTPKPQPRPKTETRKPGTKAEVAPATRAPAAMTTTTTTTPTTAKTSTATTVTTVTTSPGPVPGSVRPTSTVTTAATEPEREQPDREDRHGILLGLRLGMLIPSGRPAGVTSGANQELPWGKRAATLPVSLQLGYRLPWLQRNLAVVAEVGWYPLSSEGTRALPQDPDFGTLAYSWKGTQIPVLGGLEYRLPFVLPWIFSRLSVWGGVSFAAVYTSMTSTIAAEGIQDAPQKGWALGISLGVGASFRLGPGAITFDARYLNARTDLGLHSVWPTQPWNQSKGDVAGQNYLVGYRFAL